MDYQGQIGAIYKGPFTSRPEDYISLGFSKMRVNHRIAHRAELVNTLKWIDAFINASYQPVRIAECYTELRYSAKITPWFIIIPDIQLIFNLGGVT